VVAELVWGKFFGALAPHIRVRTTEGEGDAFATNKGRVWDLKGRSEKTKLTSRICKQCLQQLTNRQSSQRLGGN